MSTLSGIASKGEKGKSKFQSLDINNIYRGESLEPHQQKSTLPRKHGMQNLGKVPTVRRAPANLPSLRSEHSGNDPTISLVPSGGTGWGSKPGETAQPASPAQTQQTSAPVAPAPVAVPQPAVASVIPSVVSGAPSTVTAPTPAQGAPIAMQPTIHSDKLWSRVMASPGEGGTHSPSFLVHQSPQFQQEFPKLSSGDGQAPVTGQKGGSDTQYGPGPSLRPQTEGSWIQGGGRSAGQPQSQIPSGVAVSSNPPGAVVVPGPLPHIPPGGDPAGGRSSLAQCAAPAGAMAPAGPGTPVQNTAATSALPGVTPPPGGNLMSHMATNAGHHFHGIMPQFIYRPFPPNFQAPIPGTVRPRFSYPAENRFMSTSRSATVNSEEEIVPRPIIKEEELNKMDDIARDAGWATHDDDIVDYNQKLLFSDEESTQDEEVRKDSRGQSHAAKEEKRDGESNEREEHREEHREKRPEPLPPRGPPEQRSWQSGRSSMNMDFRASAPAHTSGALSGSGASHAGPNAISCPVTVMRPASHQAQGSGSRVEDDEVWTERKRQQSVEVALAIERAKHRKEEEEKRYQEAKQGAARKFQELEQKIANKMAENKEHIEEPPVHIPLPDWGSRDKERDSRERDRERDRSRASSEGREDKTSRDIRDVRDGDFRQLTQMMDRPAFMRSEREREVPRSERERDRDLRSERERKPRDSRGDRHDSSHGSSYFQNNIPPRFLKMADRSFHHIGSGVQPGPSPSMTAPGTPSQGTAPSGQGSSFSQVPPSPQAVDPRWSGPSSHTSSVVHFSGQLQGSGGTSSIPTKPSHVAGRRHMDSEASSSDREREREPDDRDRDRPPSRDPRERRERHTPESHDNRDRYRHGGREREHRVYSEGGGVSGSRKISSSSYYDGPSDYNRNYGRGPQDYGRSRERDADLDSRVPEMRDRHMGRDAWERDSRHYDDRREPDAKKDVYERHPSIHDPFDEQQRDGVREMSRQDSGGEWRDSKDWKQQADERDKAERRDQGERRDRDDRPQRPDSRDSRASRDSRNSRDSAREERSIHDSDHKFGLSSREFTGSWADAPSDSHYLDLKEDKKKCELFREERRDLMRHPPGPITREKLEASELRSDSKRNLTQLKRSTGNAANLTLGDKKSEPKKDVQLHADKSDRKPTEPSDVWNRNIPAKTTEHPPIQESIATTPPNRFAEANSNKTAWSDSLSPEITETVPKPAMQSEEKASADLKKEGEKEKSEPPTDAADKSKGTCKETDVESERGMEDAKKSEDATAEGEIKREKTTRSRSRGGRGRHDGSRMSRQNSGSFAVYRAANWVPQRDLRGRRSLHRAPPPSRSAGGEWAQGSDSEQSVDEVSVDSGKEDQVHGSGSTQRRADRDRDRESRRPPRSPKQGQKKAEKEEKNRESRRSEGDKGFAGTEAHRYEKRSPYESVRGGREGFAPSGEPTRRGRGGFRARGSVGRRMDGYGPPSSKSPFGQPSEECKVQGLCDDTKDVHKHPEGDSNKEENLNCDETMKLKQQTMSSCVIGSGTRHYSSSSGAGTNSKAPATQVPPRLQRKSESERRDSSRSKGRGGGGRGMSHLQGREGRAVLCTVIGMGSKQNSSDVADDWETTSEHSETDEREVKQDVRNGRKAFSRRDGGSRRSGGPGSSNVRSRGSAINASSPSGGSSRAPGAEKRSCGGAGGGGNSNGYGLASGQRGSGMNAPVMGGSSQANGRTAGSRSNNQTPPIPGTKVGMKDSNTAVNRVDEIKINDPSLVNQAITDLGMTKKNSRLEKEKTNALDGLDLNNFASVVVVDGQPGGAMEEERFNFDADNGFQEVRSKKNVKEARHKEEQKVQQRAVRDKDGRPKGGKPAGLGQVPSPVPGSLQQQSAQLQPPPPQPLQPVAMQVGGGSGMQGSGPPKQQFDRQKPKLPPRLARKKESSRMHKAQQQQQQYVAVHNDVSEMNKINQNITLFPMKDCNSPAPPPSVNAWDKPITASLRPNSPSANAGTVMQISSGLATSADNCGGHDTNEQPQSGGSSQRSTPNGDKATGKLGREVVEKTVLDGTSPPVQTIIFENTNYKSAPGEMPIKTNKFSNHLKAPRIDKSRERKLGEEVEEVQLGFANKNSGSAPDLNKNSDSKTDPIQMPLSFNKNEDSVDMKLDFTFDSELSQLADEKKNKGMGLSRSMHISQGVQSPITHPADDLNFKIQSVKKVWEVIPAMPTMIEHNEDGSVASTASSFTPTFGNPVDSALDPSSFSKGVDGPGVVAGDDGLSLNPGEVVYSSGPPIQSNPNSYTAVSAVPSMAKNDPTSTSSNVCKVKPQQQAVMSAGHTGPLSPPPFNSANTQQGHINYQPTLGGTTAQFGGISAIPSPPTVLYNSSQQIPGQGGLYGAFQLDGAQVLGGQARSQFSGFPPYGLNQGLGQTSAFNQQSLYLQTGPHPPPSAAPDIYSSSLSQYRIPTAQGPFAQSQQLSSNPSTVLISSTSNSLMSASVKPSSQQIGAIGTKGGGPYQQSTLPSAPQASMYIYDPNYLSGSQMVQRPGPVQSNVVPTIPHSSSFYSGSAGGQTGFYQAASSTLQQAPSAQPLHQTGSPYGLQGYGTQSGTATPVGLQGFGSQMAQPYRGTSLPGPTFLKSGSQHPSDHSTASNGRTQLKSPSNSQQDVLTSVSVFSSAPQIPSPKSRSSKQLPVQQQQQQQQSPTQQQQQQQQQAPHHKYNPYQGMSQSTPLAFQQSVRGQMNMAVRGGMAAATQRYPTPIQRPVPFQQGGGGGGGGSGGAPGSNMIGGRHRSQHQPSSRPPPPNMNKLQAAGGGGGGGQPYYGSHGGGMKMEGVADGKTESGPEGKMTDGVGGAGGNSGANGAVGGGGGTGGSGGGSGGIKQAPAGGPPQPEHSKLAAADDGKEESPAPAAE